MQLAPSVGYSQPWRIVLVESAERRTQLHAHQAENALAAEAIESDVRDKYRALKLSGLDQAPVQIAIFCDTATTTGRGLGKRTMPETLQYSVVMAIHTLWLAAAASGLGLGWVSILDPQKATECLDVERSWEFIALVCVGYAETPSQTPDLVERGWEQKDPQAQAVLVR